MKLRKERERDQVEMKEKIKLIARAKPGKPDANPPSYIVARHRQLQAL